MTRRLLALIAALMFLELVFFAVLAPLLPGLQRDLSLSTSEDGLLVATYAVGAMVFAIPAVMLATRVGVKTTALVSLLALALTSVAFGVADSYAGLMFTRFIQGAAAAACFTSAMGWLLESAPADQRGALLGLAFGVSSAGSIAGPFIGGVAASIGRATTFSVIAGVCTALALAVTRFRGPQRPRSEAIGLRLLLGASHVRATALIIVIPAAIIAELGVLAPLRQHRLGASATEVAATFGAAAAAAILIRPIFGRWADRRGPRRPIQLGLLASFPVVVTIPWLGSWFAVALAVALALVLLGVVWAPLLVILSDACVAAGVGQMTAVAVLNLAWPPGSAVGAAGAGAIAQLAGQRLAFAVTAVPLLWGFMSVSARANPAREPIALPRSF